MRDLRVRTITGSRRHSSRDIRSASISRNEEAITARALGLDHASIAYDQIVYPHNELERELTLRLLGEP